MITSDRDVNDDDEFVAAEIHAAAVRFYTQSIVRVHHSDTLKILEMRIHCGACWAYREAYEGSFSQMRALTCLELLIGFDDVMAPFAGYSQSDLEDGPDRIQTPDNHIIVSSHFVWRLISEVDPLHQFNPLNQVSFMPSMYSISLFTTGAFHVFSNAVGDWNDRHSSHSWVASRDGRFQGRD